MRAFVANRFTLLALVVLALAALFGVAWVTRAAGDQSQRAGQPQAVPVASAVRSCPSPGAGRVAVFAAAGGAQGSGRAQLVAAPSLPASAAPLVTLTQPGQLWLSRTGFPGAAAGTGARASRRSQRVPAGAAVTVAATGPMAQGLEVEQTTYPPNGSPGSATGVQCVQPGTDFWFLGPGPAKSSGLDLFLVNPDTQATSADVEIFTDTGPLQGNTDTGIAVPPGGSVVQSVAKFVNGSRVVALHVRTSVGRVAAAVRAAGAWWRAGSAPDTQVVIPGLPGAGTGRRLYVADPGGSDAQVHVRAVTPAGSYEPAGAGGIDVPAGSVVALDLPSLNGIPAALQLTSAVPVTAAMLVGGQAYTAAAGPVEQQGVLADNVSGAGLTTSLVLSAPAGPAQVRISMAGPGGPVGTARLVSVPGGHSSNVTVTPPRNARGGFAVVVTPVNGSGPVYAGRVVATRSGSVALLTPVLSSPVTVALPHVSDEPGAAIP